VAPVTSSASVRRAPQRGSYPGLRLVSGRGVPELVTLRRTTALEAPLEGLALAQESGAAARRLLLLCDSLMASVEDARLARIRSEGRRLLDRSRMAEPEFRRLAGLVDGPDGKAA
jgi:hypothetical protein